MVPGFAQNRKTMTVSPYVLPGLSQKIGTVDVKEMEARISDVFNINPQSLHSKTRVHETVFARYLCYAVMYFAGRWKKLHIAQHYRKHHSSVLHGIREFRNMYETDEAFRDTVKGTLRYYVISEDRILNYR